MPPAHARIGGTAAKPADDDARLREALAACPIGVAILARGDGRRLFVNDALVEMLGAGAREALLEGDITRTWADPARLAEVWSVFQNSGTVVNFEAERVRADGSRWWVLMNTQPTVFEGIPAGIVWHVDITDRKRAEEAARESEARLREAVESLSDGFALFDPEDRLVFCNRTYRDLNPDLGPLLQPGVAFEALVRDNLAHGRVVGAIGREADFLRERLAHHRDPGAPHLSQRGDGHWIQIREKRAPDGSTFLVHTDVTELKQREDALREEKERAEQASGFKSQFLATMSHELRTPLNAILGFSDVLERELFGPLGHRRYREYAGDIHASGEHLLDLINDVLDLSRIEAGRYVLSLQEIDTAEVVRSACDVLTELARARNLRFRIDIAAELPRIRADGRAVRQILLNLLSNAIKFTPRDGGVSVEATHDGEGRIVFEVADTGIGIAEEHLDTVLTPFGKVATHAFANEGGTGLGLSIVSALVDMHGGTLEIDSRVGEGTRITVRLPASCVVA